MVFKRKFKLTKEKAKTQYKNKYNWMRDKN